MKKIIIPVIAALGIALGSCTNDLDQQPQIGVTSGVIYSTVEGYESVMAKIYGSYSLIGQSKAGQEDLSSYSGHDLMRNYFNLQEGTTDEAAFRWLSGDNLWSLPFMNWDNSCPSVSDVYYRLYYSIALCNEFLRYCSDDVLSGFSADEQARLRTYASEARFMRALSYSLVLDLFRQGPFVDENTPTSGVMPPALDAAGLFEYIEGELLAIEGSLENMPPYGRAGKGAVYTLLGRLYLNSEVYTGIPRWTECISACKKAMGMGYSLEPDYLKLFNGENNLRTNEIILAFANDATNATTWGSGTYIVCGCIGSDNAQSAPDYGISTGWGSFRVHGQFYELFKGADGDSRNTFFTDGQTQYITTSLEDGTQGYHACKFTNLTDGGDAASNSAADGCNTDIPFFRLADVYLIAAEATVRGGEGMTRSEALELVNAIRGRAYGDASGNITDAQLTLDFLIDERGRELYLEMTRRTDLVRFGLFTTDKYLWNWKGGTADGRAVDARYNYFPIPASELSANSNLKNMGY
ncbi:MAG: RagB/SusD family nutrient uptake outer membrane protein [Muribaculaceae bacterium]|nr:RagB/SusD family nutrient uptake outer membrane protein [Muribaculaceae bacterium]